jgi:hypothetical protein
MKRLGFLRGPARASFIRRNNRLPSRLSNFLTSVGKLSGNSLATWRLLSSASNFPTSVSKAGGNSLATW